MRDNIVNGSLTCTPPALEEFPGDLFTPEQRRKGAVLFHIFVSFYLFVALAVVCDKYFVPAVEKICEVLDMSKDVAGATFMAAATSAPELFVNIIGTFVTEGDIGIGTIVGSAVFNILAIAACCGLCAKTVVPLHWWPITRDCVAYGITVIALICIIQDETVNWYEALILVLLYVIYLLVLYWDKTIQIFFFGDVKEEELEVKESESTSTYQMSNAELVNQCTSSNENTSKIDSEEEGVLYSLSFPKEAGWFKVVMWVITLPIHVVFTFTIPDCTKERFEKWFPLTFIMCIAWIGSLSYVVAWMITIIGDTFKIPDSVMGLTFLAAGTSVPEAVSSIIVAKQGDSIMGISNSLGSNSFDILLCLGLPWLIKSSFLPSSAGHHCISIHSLGLEYTAVSLLLTLLVLYCTVVLNKFKLNKKVGFICLITYIIFLITATLTELNVFFVVNLPTCTN